MFPVPPADISNVLPREASVGSRMIVSRTELSLDSMEVEATERAMIPVYEDAYK